MAARGGPSPTNALRVSGRRPGGSSGKQVTFSFSNDGYPSFAVTITTFLLWS
jgi:hypothetical protein